MRLYSMKVEINEEAGTWKFPNGQTHDRFDLAAFNHLFGRGVGDLVSFDDPREVGNFMWALYQTNGNQSYP